MTPTSAKPQISDWVRYPAAVVVAFLMSVATVFLFVVLGDAFGLSSPILSFVFVVSVPLFAGFNGVFFGSLCFQRCKRVFGSVVLLVLGLGVFILMTASVTVARGESFGFQFVFITAIGGAAAIAIHHWRQQPNNALEPLMTVLSSTKAAVFKYFMF